MTIVLIGVVAFLASALTFVSGFGLGTLLMPVFAVFMPLERAIAVTGVVHFLNSLFKFALVGRRAAWPVVVRFGVPALLASLVGAWLLVSMADLPPVFTYDLGARRVAITPVRLVVGLMLLTFVLVEWVPRWRSIAFPPALMPIGGLVSGLAGGLSGMQGALRSAFLARAGLDAPTFVATGVAIACLIDVSRVGVYARLFLRHRDDIDLGLVGAAVACAFAGALVGRRYLDQLSMDAVRHVVAVLLLAMAVAMMLGF